ncbi:MAG TPA: YfcE family phosphodiesterase [Phycisphaerae bacterium]|nr:YfcE family phosphodiesterase [Phycisphaerae bacterium]
MLVGIMSDSHGDTVTTAQAVELLTQRGAKKLFHCGDICGADVLAELAGHDAAFVWGNCDAPSASLREYVATLGLPWPQEPVRMEIDGKRIAVCHGHEKEFRRAAEDPTLDYLFYGHTHRYADRRKGRCRIINPGALHRAAIKTVATLDLLADDLRFWRIDTGQEIR